MKTSAGAFAGSRVASVSLIQHIQGVYPLPGSSEDVQHLKVFGIPLDYLIRRKDTRGL